MKNIFLLLFFVYLPSMVLSQTNQIKNTKHNRSDLTSIEDLVKDSESINKYLDHLEKIHRDFSGQILIYRNDREVFYQSRGFANEEFKVKGNKDTAYNLASISKMLTAIIVLKMQEEGLVDIYSPIANYIKELKGISLGETTIYELQTHTSGLPEKYENYLWKFVHVEKHGFHMDSIINHLKDVKIKTEDKGSTDYTNLGPLLASLALERISDMPYKLLLEKYIIDPLGLTNTGLAVLLDQDVITVNKAKTYEYWYGSIYEYPFAKVGLLGAAAGLHSSVNDLQKIINAVFVDKTFLSTRSYEILTKPYKEDSIYSFGCFNMKFKGSPNEKVNVLGHEGFIWGVSTAAFYMPEEQLGFILLSNRGFSQDLENDMRKMITLLSRGEVEFPKMNLEYKIMAVEDDKEFYSFVNSLDQLEELKKEYEVEEYNINDLGYTLMNERYKYKKAEAIFKLNCRLFPDSSNTYDSLGEIQYTMKNYEGSLKNYKTSFELDPENENAKHYIKLIIDNKG